MTLNLTITKRDNIAPMAELLTELSARIDCEACEGKGGECEACEGAGGFYRTPEDAAKHVLERAWEMYEAKGKFVVLGAMIRNPEGATDPITAERVCFGPYGTETKARDASAQLFYSTATGEEFVRWLLPMNHGTPAAWARERKQAREAAEAAEDPGYTLGVPPEHQIDPERQAKARAAQGERMARNAAAWERAMRLRDHQQELDPEVPRIREENAA